MQRNKTDRAVAYRTTKSAIAVQALLMLTAAAMFNGFGRTAAAQNTPTAVDGLSIEQARLADRYERLEMVLGRLAELSASTDPRRARLLREAIAKSRDQDLNQRFETIVSLLEDERLSTAAGRQTELQRELDELLTLLLKADRDRELESQSRRIKKYLQEVGRLIRLQKGIKARTEGGDGTERLTKDQQLLADRTGELGDTIDETERSDDEQSNNQQPDSDNAREDEADNQQSDQDESAERAGDGDGQPQDGSQGDSKPQDAPPNNQGQPTPNGDGQPSESTPSPSGQPSTPSESPPSSGSPSSGSPSSGQSSPQQSQQQPTDRAAERLRSAQERMQQAQQQLDEAERDGAAAEQREAIKQLEQAKAELERVLRQLREEEMERTLTLLAARFRRMLDAQLKVNEGTVRLNRKPVAQRNHDDEIESARLSREESLIAREADRALMLLREEGSSVAFPETVSLMRDDMRQVTRRLADLKVGEITQGLEQDIIEALEEMIVALEEAIQDLERQRPRAGQSPPAGQPTKPKLVKQIAELKLIRSLQMRIYRRTQLYGKMIEGKQAEAPELLEALSKLAERQQRVYQATYDLSQGRND